MLIMPLTLPKPGPCIECGESPVFHKATYASIVIDELLSPLSRPGRGPRFLARAGYALEERISPMLFDAFVALGMATRLTEPDADTTLLGATVWEEGKRRGISINEIRLFGLPRNIFVATYPDGRRIAYEGIPSDLRDLDRVSWMDNKAELKRRFRKAGIPIADGGEAHTLERAKRVFDSIRPPVIVKPHSGSGSRHTTLQITTHEELARAFAVAKMVTPLPLIEEQLEGLVYRVTVVDGVYAAALRRFPPQVAGDGTSTVAELVAKENEHPLRAGPYFSRIRLADKADAELARQGLARDSIPEEGRIVTLHQKINWTVGGTTEDATEDAHPENIALFERIAKELKAPVMGMDFIIGDLSRPWHEQERIGVLECNSMPFFENHLIIFRGTPRNIAAKVWDMVAPASS
jgi:D-alanine-D-alanine ligase-like ATP-grasp enzyme